MKLTSRLPLRWRITLMTGAIVLASNLCMMFVSIYSANTGFDVVLTNVSYYYQNSDANEVVMNDAGETETSENGTYRVEEESEVITFDQKQENLSEYMPNELTDADAASSTVYFPDNSSVSRNFNLISILTMCVTTILGMVIAYVLSARALRPIYQLNQSVLTITGNNLNRRVEESEANDEVGSLQKSFNGMMDRLETSFNRQKEFSRNVAHELKTPLTTMKTGFQVLRMDEHPAWQDVQRLLSVTEKNIDRLIAIVQDLFLFTMEERVEFNDEIDVRGLLEKLIEEQNDIAKKHQVEFSLECPEEIVVLQNEALLTRALNNLIENALKYNKPFGKVNLKVSQKRQFVHIEIQDTGIGIDKEQIERIWEPFYCVDKSRSRKLGGAGIGLALVRSISEKCGFDVFVSSEKEKGTVFTIEIPYHL
ncbi:MAG: HAMP domain-containing histidine kinase [Erysipelotrichaceae bacterium]|nr:HAMP domain-containing histidine kinase [Erysipelotrichaceae bacterium]